MTYEAFETSLESGQPVELYKFTAGSLVFRFTSSQDETITFGPSGVSYLIK